MSNSRTKKIEIYMQVDVPTEYCFSLEVPVDGIEEPEDVKFIGFAKLDCLVNDPVDHFCSADWKNFYQGIEEALEKT